MRRKSYEGLITTQWVAVLAHLAVSAICMVVVIASTQAAKRTTTPDAEVNVSPPTEPGPRIIHLIYEVQQPRAVKPPRP